ncbi:hypothetical protein RB614_08170 [Phytohabitans sp. ZYX-F-186]|uniref:CU044_5270 family protein n=1 Tax=Phytohabitans maris TaxID=3071409 RepID=A0ABU0ZBT9_9ACTN|nr:hypothetical protein [Phytohabitans sp. ZYX-F-186]MDQ7904498.1 hypothetical protein [Phytohabitans sp. ZYX-F-186]
MGHLEEDEEHADEVVRQVVLGVHPARDLPVPPPQATSAELRARADAGHTGGSVRWALPVVVGTTVAAVALLGAVGGGLLTSRGATDEPPAALSSPSTVPVSARAGTPSPLVRSTAGDPPAARSHLAALARSAARAPKPAAAGAYTYVHVQTWTAGRSRGARPTSRDERLWWAADRSGRAETVALSQPPPVPVPGAPGASTSDAAITTYEPGKVPVLVDAPSAQAPLLAFQLADRHPLSEGPRGMLRAVADLYRSHHLDPAQRAAALQVLADTEGIDYRGTVVDRSGRSGVAVSVDSDGGATRDVAIFDPGAGRLLSYERVELVGAATSPSRSPALVAYVLYLNSGRTGAAGAIP